MNRHFSFIKWQIKDLEKNTRLHQRNLNKLNMPTDFEVNSLISNAIKSREPFCILRPGKSEYSLVMQWDERKLFGIKKYLSNSMYKALDYNEMLLRRWVNQFKEDIQIADFFSCVGRKTIEEGYLVDNYVEQAIMVLGNQVETFGCMENSWLRELEGRKVLVVSPFTETMKQQYDRKDLIWKDLNLMPDMDMRYLKSVWYIDQVDNDGFNDWFDALDYLLKEMREIDYDIALIGCGPFSIFLAADAKRKGKQAIQFGGALQLLFGIRGKRWDNDDRIKKYYNQYWVRPGDDNSPKEKNSIDLDRGDYW